MHTMHDTPNDTEKTAAGTPHHHAVVWLDHHQARVIHFSLQAADEEVVRPEPETRHLHSKAGSASGTHLTVAPEFCRDIAEACGQALAILLVGPSTAKTEYVAYLQKHLPQIAGRIAGMETMDKVTDPQLLALGRRFFLAEDRMTPQTD